MVCMIFSEHGFILYAVLALVFLLIEALTFSLTTIWFAASALVMMFVSFLPIPFHVQLLMFLAIACVLLIFTRPLLVNKIVKHTATNADALIGKECRLLKKIGEFQNGEIKLRGIIWSAKSVNGCEIAENAICKIVKIEGNTVFVEQTRI